MAKHNQMAGYVLTQRDASFERAESLKSSGLKDLGLAFFLLARGILKIFSAIGNLTFGLFLTLIILMIPGKAEASIAGGDLLNGNLDISCSGRIYLTSVYGSCAINRTATNVRDAAFNLDSRVSSVKDSLTPLKGLATFEIAPHVARGFSPVTYAYIPLDTFTGISLVFNVAPTRGAPFGGNVNFADASSLYPSTQFKKSLPINSNNNLQNISNPYTSFLFFPVPVGTKGGYNNQGIENDEGEDS